MDVEFQLYEDNTIGFKLGSYDNSYPITIDPTYRWHTFHGSDDSDEGFAIALDRTGNIYVAGRSEASWGNPVNPDSGGTDIAVLKLYGRTEALQWNTFHGSGNHYKATAIAVDESGNVYVAGWSAAPWGEPVNPHSGNWDIVVLKLDGNTGALQWNTFHGSETYRYDEGLATAVDSEGNVYVAGFSQAAWGNPVNPHSGGTEGSDMAILKLDSSGVLQWNTFHGSTSDDYGYAVALDSTGNLYVAGGSKSAWGNPLNSHSGGYDIAVLKLDSATGALQWNTFYGCTTDDGGHAIALDSSGNVYLAGGSQDTWGSPVNHHSGGSDIAVIKLSQGPSPSFFLTVTKAGTGSGLITSSPEGIECGNDCSEEYARGTTVNLRAKEDVGSSFIGWSGDEDCFDGVVTMDADKSCTAIFDRTHDILTISKAGTGNGTVSATGCVLNWTGDTGTCEAPPGTKITLSAAADIGSTWEGWSAGTGSAASCRGKRKCSFKLTEDSGVAAIFEIKHYTLKVKKRGKGTGTVDAAGCTLTWEERKGTCRAPYGTSINLSASADPGSVWVGWSRGKGSAVSCTGTEDCTFTLTRNSKVEAVFDR